MARKGYTPEQIINKLRVELLSREVFNILEEAKVLIEQWKMEYDQIRPYSALSYRSPAPEARMLVTLT